MKFIEAIKLKKDIWFYKKGHIFFYKDDKLFSKEPNKVAMQTLDSLAEAIMTHVEDDDEYVEIVKAYKYEPAEYMTDFEGNKYKLVSQ